MKPARAALLLAIGLMLPALPARADRRLAEAEALAQRNEPAAAADLYRALLKDGVDGAALRYNLGTLALEAGDVGEAVLHLRAARRLRPGDEDIRHNLEVALEARTDRLAGDPVAEPMIAMGGRLPPLAARLALALPLGLLAAALAALGFVVGRARAALRIAIALLSVTAVAGAVLFGARLAFEGRREAVVIAAEAPALKDPAPDATRAFIAHAGLHGEVVDESGGYARVRFENGLEAWIAASDLGFIPELSGL
jgi:tetratricopeptide (TPR) repeat protein